MVTSADVVIVGAGVVGLSCAVHLASAGATVSVLESQTVGGGASTHNAGWVVPSMCDPVPSPAALRLAARQVWRPDGPVKVGFRWSPAYASFLLGMLAHSRGSKFAQGRALASTLALEAIPAYDRLAALGVSMDRHRRGVLRLFLDSDVAPGTDHSYIGGAEYLSRRDVDDLVANLGPLVQGAVFTPRDEYVDPATLMEGLSDRCRALGVRIHEGRSLRRAIEARDSVTMMTDDGSITASHVVLAAGVGSRRIAQTLGVSLPVFAGKGYGFDYGPELSSRGPALYLTEAKVAVTPLRRGLRLSGTMEFGSEGMRAEGRRPAGIHAAAAKYFAQWPSRPPAAWAGLRPMTPDGLPVIGLLRESSRVVAATGHAMLGVTLGPLTGELVLAIVAGDDPPLARPFSPMRF